MIQPITSHSKPKKESMLLNIGFNLMLPMLFLMKGETIWFGDYLKNIIDDSKR